VEEVEAVIARHWNGKQVSVATDTDATRGRSVFYPATARQQHTEQISSATNQQAIKKLLEVVFSMQSIPRI
jgi:hypothetical protein